MDWFVRIWIPIAIAVTGMCAVSFFSDQRIYRQSLNDPQVQIAEDLAFQIDRGMKPSALVSTSTIVDISSSLRTYTAIYDKDLNPIVWNGEYRAQAPMPPRGVFDDAKGAAGTGPGENRVTWQPDEDTRSAIVVVHILKTDGYVLVGRNMREIEDRIWSTQALVGIAWIFTLLATLIATWVGGRVAAGKTGVVW